MKVATIVIDDSQEQKVINFYGNMQPNEALAYMQRFVIVQEARKISEDNISSSEESVGEQKIGISP